MMKNMRIVEKIKEIRKKRYWEKRARKWENFKSKNDISKIQCGLIKKTIQYTPKLWEYDCLQDYCCNKDYFEQYGCMYIKGFIDY